jgi:hypothetical protein
MANEFKVRKGLVVNGSGSVLLDIQGSQGQLFSVTDQLSGSLFSVSDISGIPVMEAFSDNTIKIGKYGSEAIKVSGSVASVSGSFTGSFSGSLFGTASQALTASYLLGGVSAQVFPYSGSAQITGSLGITGSLNVTLGITGSLFGTASQALTASYVLGGGSGVGFPYSGSAQITGSLGVTGSISASGSIGSTLFSSNADSLLISGSLNLTGSFTQVGYQILTAVSQSFNYADDTAAAAGGVPLGGLYRNGNFILIRLS